jgi:hypothetical protein
MSIESQIRDWVEQTPFVDTHEHLIEESQRVAGAIDGGRFPCDDWAYLFMHYLGSDLVNAGMPGAAYQRFLAPEVCAEEKYRLVAPYWERTIHTGYAQAVRRTLRDLYGVNELTQESAPILAEKYKALVKPGFYREILRERSNLENCQVNSLQRIFMETEQPDLLPQDLSFVALSTGPDLKQIEQDSGKTATTLDGWLEIIDWYFATYGPRAVAVKNQSAYSRRLDYEAVPKEQAEPLFARHAKDEKLAPEELKTLQDHLFRYCVGKATEYGLPVKLHTGYYAGHGGMPLARLRQNAGDLCPLLKDFPDTKFVLMHIGYPYQDEFIALAKHYPNAYIDLCWAWIINPLAGVRFVKEFLMAAPANKLFTFGGDYVSVETVYGHSRVARQGLTQALSELVAEGWIALEEIPPLVERIMRGNAHEVFPTRAG